ncbi:MAG: T9SS type A sorting domain-containing protein [Lewinellaceae bacterium]|nr:T9SS type A sorting domain-containing protein [Lewinellaceae bacterium]
MKPSDAKEVMRQMEENRVEMRNFVWNRDAITYIPVRFYLVAKDDGSKRPSELVALKALCDLNENYTEQDVQFYLKELKPVNSTEINADVINVDPSIIKTTLNISYNALNIIMVEGIGEEGVLAYYQPPATGQLRADWIVALRSEIQNDSRVLTHEMGHYLSLPHPFYGWESTLTGWDPAINGNPVGALAPDNETLNEKVNGSNCHDAGDKICDTPADYMFPYPGPDPNDPTNTQCFYNLSAKDPNGVPLQPEMKNYMNYATCTDYFFTDGQKTEMQNSLFSSSRSYLNLGPVPNLTPVTSTPTLIAPLDFTETYNNVKFEWTPVPGADRYWLEITPIGGISQRIIVQDNTYTAYNLEANKNYFWKVKGFNEYATCAGTSAQELFKTGGTLSDTFEIPTIDDWDVSPNPVGSNTSFFVNVKSNGGVEAKIMLYTMTGQLVNSAAKTFLPGYSSFEVPVNGLAVGLYLVALRTDEGIETKRIAIVK